MKRKEYLITMEDGEQIKIDRLGYLLNSPLKIKYELVIVDHLCNWQKIKIAAIEKEITRKVMIYRGIKETGYKNPVCIGLSKSIKRIQ